MSCENTCSGDAARTGSQLTFEVFQDGSNEWRWRLKAVNGKTIADSGEGYQNRVDCLAAIGIIQSQASAAFTTFV